MFDDVDAALLALADANDLDRIRAYYSVLDSVGNNHCGTYRAGVLSVIPRLGEPLRSPALVVRLVEPPTGRRSLKAMVKQAAALLADDVERICRTPGSEEEALLVGELLPLLRASDS
jgi:hypothetical protein